MIREEKLVKNTILYALGNIGSKMLVFMLVPLYTKFLSTEEVGYFDIVINTAMLLIPIITFQITDGIYRFILEAIDIDKKNIIITNGIFIILTNIGIFTVIYSIISVFSKLKNPMLIYLYIIFNILYTCALQVARALQKNKLFAVSGIVVTLSTLILNIVFVVSFKLKVRGLLIAYIIGFLLGLIFLCFKLSLFKYIDLNKRSMNEMLALKRYSLPLIPNAISWWIMNLSDRYIIASIMGNGLNGIYSISNKFASILILINSIFSLAWQESAIIEYKSKDRDEYYTKMFAKYMTLQITFTIILIIVTKKIFYIVIDSKFYHAYQCIPILYLATVFSSFSLFFGTGYLSSNDTKGSFNTTVVGATINILFNIVLTPKMGLNGAAIATLLSYLIVWIIRIVQTKKYFKIKIEKKNLLILIGLVAIYIYIYYLESKYYDNIMFILSLLIFYIYNKKLIVNICYKVKKIIYEIRFKKV